MAASSAVCKYMSRLKLSEKAIFKYRSAIEGEMLNKFGLKGQEKTFDLTVQLLDALWKCYDTHFFKGKLAEALEKAQYRIIFTLNNRLSSKAGKCHEKSWNGLRKCWEVKLEFAPKIFSSLFTGPDLDRKTYENYGVVCHDRIQCLQIILEHFLVHAFLFMFEEAVAKKLDHPPMLIKLSTSLFRHTTMKQGMKGIAPKVVNCTGCKAPDGEGRTPWFRRNQAKKPESLGAILRGS